MSSVGNVTFKMAYNGTRFFYFDNEPIKIPIEKIAVQVGKKETYLDTYFVDFSKLGKGARIEFVSDKTKKVSHAISVPLEATKEIFVRLEGRVKTTQIAATAKSEPVEFTSGSAHHIFIETFNGKPKVTFPNSEDMSSDSDSDSSDEKEMSKNNHP